MASSQRHYPRWQIRSSEQDLEPQISADIHSPACGRNQKDFKPRISQITQIKKKKPNYFETAILTKQLFNYLEKYFSCLELAVQMHTARPPAGTKNVHREEHEES